MFHNFLSLEGPIYRFMNLIWKLMFLNLLIIVTSFPIVTIGVSQTAAFGVAIRLIEQKDRGVWHDFWKYFRENIKSASLSWGFLLLAGLALTTIWSYSFRINEYSVWLLGVGVVSILVAHLSQVLYFYLARFDGSQIDAIKNCTKLFLKYPVQSICLILISFLPIIGLLLSSVTLIVTIYSCLFISLAGIIYIRAGVLLNLFESASIL